MKVSDILQSKGNAVATVRPEATISTVVHRLRLERIGALVVSEDGVKVNGIISERDVVNGLAEEGGGLLDRHVDHLMTRAVKTCGREANLRDVMTLMTNRRIRHLPVVEDGRLIGIISIGDVVKSRLQEVEMEAGVLRDAYIASH